MAVTHGEALHSMFETLTDSIMPPLCSTGPIAAPLNLRVSDIENTQVTVHWDPVERSSIMGELKEYKVC